MYIYIWIYIYISIYIYMYIICKTQLQTLKNAGFGKCMYEQVQYLKTISASFIFSLFQKSSWLLVIRGKLENPLSSWRQGGSKQAF